ncbi:MAG: NPCBM/NEW2 domain-containing protein [Phycisphaerae bacterium]|nr:NPCBM/NEW2 domain-containing protein [Phycisphaerae bacterium]
MQAIVNVIAVLILDMRMGRISIERAIMLKRGFLLCCIMVLFIGGEGWAKEVWLGDLDLRKIKVGAGSPRKNKCYSGWPMAVGGQAFEHGVGVHANSSMHIDLAGDATRFVATVGVDDSVKARTGATGSVNYQILAEGKMIWESKILKSGDAAEIDIDVTGVKYLTLLCGDGYDGISHDHADWAGAKITYHSTTPALFTLAERPALKGTLPEHVKVYFKEAPDHVKKLFTTHVLPDVLKLKTIKREALKQTDRDWLIEDLNETSSVCRIEGTNDIVLTNGLVSRVFRLTPNVCTIGLDNHTSGEAVLRALRPEARVTLDGTQYNIGGLVYAGNQSYLRDTFLESLGYDPESFHLVGLKIGRTQERFPWKRVRRSANLPWPAPGISLRMDFAAPNEIHAGLVFSVHYELYDHVPIMSKWFTLDNHSAKPVNVDTFDSEILAVMHQSQVYCETDYACGGEGGISANRAVHWDYDPQRTTERQREICLLELHTPFGPDVTVEPGGTFESFRAFELFMGSDDTTRVQLAKCQLYRTVAPWITENPIMMHVRSSDETVVKQAIDQCADVGFEMVIVSFWSGFDHENTDPAYLKHWKQIADYAREKGIDIGSYSLLASRKISPDVDVIDLKTGEPGHATYGNAPCLGSDWGKTYINTLKTVIEHNGFQVFEHDGSYAADTCASTKHPGHKGYKDSQWTQWRTITDLYKWSRAHGIYLNVPDWYFLSGSSKIMMPYKEDNWSLPREEQVILARDHIYDGTSKHPPSMGWMMLPLVAYQGGDGTATLEPLCEHLDFYEYHLALNFACGVQSCYRGPRIYDTQETRQVVKKWVDFYKTYRGILDSDIVHIRRPDGRHIDGMLHVNPELEEKGLAVFFNPRPETVETTQKVPLYYTGLKHAARVSHEGVNAKPYQIDREYSIELTMTIKPAGMTWFVIE